MYTRFQTYMLALCSALGASFVAVCFQYNCDVKHDAEIAAWVQASSPATYVDKFTGKTYRVETPSDLQTAIQQLLQKKAQPVTYIHRTVTPEEASKTYLSGVALDPSYPTCAHGQRRSK